MNNAPTGAPVYWSPGMTLDSMEREVIIAAYSFYRGVKTTTAAALGISVRTLDSKLERYEQEQKNLETSDYGRKEYRERELHYARFGRPAVSPAAPQQAHGVEAEGGVRTQSSPNSAEKQAVPLPERKEIQGVLLGQAAANRQPVRR